MPKHTWFSSNIFKPVDIKIAVCHLPSFTQQNLHHRNFCIVLLVMHRSSNLPGPHFLLRLNVADLLFRHLAICEQAADRLCMVPCNKYKTTHLSINLRIMADICLSYSVVIFILTKMISHLLGFLVKPEWTECVSAQCDMKGLGVNTLLQTLFHRKQEKHKAPQYHDIHDISPIHTNTYFFNTYTAHIFLISNSCIYKTEQHPIPSKTTRPVSP